MLKFPIYLDYSATTPVDPRVAADADDLDSAAEVRGDIERAGADGAGRT